MEPLAVVAVLMFVGASLHDLRERRVRNRYWVPFGVAAALHWLTLAWQDEATLAAMFWAAGSCVFFYLFWRLRMYGGADAKGLMVLAWLVPGVPASDAATTLAIDALVNATFVMLALPVAFLAWNLARGDVRFPAAFLGLRMPIAQASTSAVWPMQVMVGDVMRWRYRMPRSDDMWAQWEGLQRAGVVRPWVTPKVPFMLPLTAGLLLAMAFGDLVLRAVSAFVVKASI